MGASLTQRRRVGDEGLRVVKPCRVERTMGGQIALSCDGTTEGSTGQFRASSRGKTEGASVARNHWA
jgi:hypothetical protein